jgi:uncharacterized protein (TIGR03435 family)
MANHLWQSTLCLIIAGLLTLVLRKNHARARYGLWLAASMKFLIPFSLLITLGTHLARPRVVAPTGTGFFFAMEEVSQPFTKAPGTVERQLPPELTADWRYRLLPAIPPVFTAVWLGGFLLIMVGWWRRWRQAAEALDASVPLRDGREVEALRRVEHRAGVRKPIDVLLSPTSLEPGIFGIVRPVLVWPAGISEHLQDAHLEAILAHEVEHVRRQDNLAAAIHMVVEALFWFHPLVWWLGARMVEERELACDEEVLQLVGQPQVYAESILKTCQFCLESPLACVSGITGAELKKRIVRIMTQHPAGKLSVGKKLLLVALGVAAIAGPVVWGLVNAPEIRALVAQTTGGPLPSFEVASIKLNPGYTGNIMESRPTGLRTPGATARKLIAFAYNVQQFQVSGGPSWISSDKYAVEAKVDDSLVEQQRNLQLIQQDDQINLMTQSLLADRFKLKVSHATKEVPIFALVIANNGPKLQESQPGDTDPSRAKGPDSHERAGRSTTRVGGIRWTDRGVSMLMFAEQLSRHLGRPVVDRTGLKARYSFNFEFMNDQTQTAMFKMPEGGGTGPDNAPPLDSSVPSIFTAIQEQLGLKLESTKGPVDIIVIDHIERPSEN